jgi:hypothetical protein
MQGTTTKSGYAAPKIVAQGQVATITLGTNTLTGEPIAGLHISGEI